MFSLSSNSKAEILMLKQSGFSLVELLVSISIITIVVSVIIVQQTSFNGAVLLRNEAYEVALTLRNIQLNAVSASVNNGSFRALYGAHFRTDTNFNQIFPIFKDADGDGFYDANEVFGPQGNLDPRFEIRDIRTNGDTYNTAQGLSVVFERPNFDAKFYDSAGEVNASSVEIDVAKKGVSGTGVEVLRTVEITSAGQISVQ
jgi:prepilin-type N-terminal cleavage/methylation domain-containing protein